ncbi:MAG: NAD(P)/FAD-dependent oxidoreductase [Candidatus Omnitrophota bacterium]
MINPSVSYDVCVIGAGWAGFNAALKAAKSGKKVCLIEEKDIGGTCLNRGCIPTKALARYSKQGLPFGEIQKKKNEVVLRLLDGMLYHLKVNTIDFQQGRAVVGADGRVSVDGIPLETKFILIAAGSLAAELPDLKLDHNQVLSSDDVLEFDRLPRSILIVGAGAIGCEFASIFKKLGAQVTIVEIKSQLLPGFDIQTCKKLQQLFQKDGIKVILGKSFKDLNRSDYDKIFLCVGRRGFLENTFEKGFSLTMDKGFIQVDDQLKTSLPHIFAVGDCIGGMMLAHVASYEGELAVHNMFSEPKNRDYSCVPSSVFTAPEVAFIGLSENAIRDAKTPYSVQSAHYLAVGMAHILEETEGFVKVMVDEKDRLILGASIIGPQATELINVFSILMKNKIPIQGLKDTILAHPSVSEILGEVAKAFE